MNRRYIAERGAKKPSNDRQLHVDRNTTINEALDIFVRAKEAEGVRPGTVRNYRSVVRYLQDWLDNGSHFINDLTADMIREYINYLRNDRSLYEGDEIRQNNDKKLSVNTINIRIRTLRTMFKFLYNEGIIEANPMMNISQVKHDEHEEVPGLTDEQVDKILATYDDKQYAQWRDKTLVLLLLDSGLRINEALSLTEEQIDFRQLTLYVPSQIAKNRKQREIPLSREVAKRLRQLLDETQHYFGENSQVFMSAFGYDFTADAFRRRLNRLKSKLNLSRLHPHMFRHTFARNYILNGGDLFTLQRILDHAEINTTRKYVQMDNEHIRQQHNKFSPLRNIVKRNGIRI
ncbi:tyrosine-type recombinase/integrase [Cytobacillus praedii]|uniref:tyrosine-type recombinase/integrase n=1 Tax=Cytobacillus praedii TaxID=1742358 RepID=UPI0007092115|nr:tyrosine-type recombinase/integrase [Cytobacillus praedii]